MFHRVDDTPQYLLLHYPPRTSADKKRGGHWDLPKGHIEKGEVEEQSVRREIQEETGITELELVPGFRERTHYFYKHDGELMKKFVTFFLAEAAGDTVTLSHEHDDYVWLPYEKAIEQLTYETARGIFRKAHEHLTGDNTGAA